MGKCCEGVSWRSGVVKCCRQVLLGSVVKDYCGEVF